MPITRLDRGPKVVCRHQIGEHVVPNHRRVLIRTGDTVEMPDAVPVVMAQRHPQPGGFHQYGEPAVSLQRIIACHNAIPLEGHRDIGIDVPGRRACGPVCGALLPADGPPRERGARKIQFRGPVPREIQGRGAPA